MLETFKKILARNQRESQELKGKHPKLHEKSLEKERRTKQNIEHVKKRIEEFDKPRAIEVKTEQPKPRNLEKYNISLEKGLHFHSLIAQAEGYGPDALRANNHEMLLLMAQNNGEIAAADGRARRIAQTGFVHSPYDEIEMWSILVRKKYVIEVGQATGSLKPFFVKSKSGRYRPGGKGMSGYEPSEYSIGVYKLTEKGWDKADWIVNFIRKAALSANKAARTKCTDKMLNDFLTDLNAELPPGSIDIDVNCQEGKIARAIIHSSEEGYEFEVFADRDTDTDKFDRFRIEFCYNEDEPDEDIAKWLVQDTKGFKTEFPRTWSKYKDVIEFKAMQH